MRRGAVFFTGRCGATAESRIRTSGMVLASARRASSYRCFKLVYTFSASVTARRSRASSIARGGIWRKELEPASIPPRAMERSEEHTSELQSQSNLVCRLLLEKKKKNKERNAHHTHK